MYMLHFSQLHGDFIIICTNTNIQEINTYTRQYGNDTHYNIFAMRKQYENHFHIFS
jgi:hypothetical protein